MGDMPELLYGVEESWGDGGGSIGRPTPLPYTYERGVLVAKHGGEGGFKLPSRSNPLVIKPDPEVGRAKVKEEPAGDSRSEQWHPKLDSQHDEEEGPAAHPGQETRRSEVTLNQVKTKVMDVERLTASPPSTQDTLDRLTPSIGTSEDGSPMADLVASLDAVSLSSHTQNDHQPTVSLIPSGLDVSGLQLSVHSTTTPLVARSNPFDRDAPLGPHAGALHPGDGIAERISEPSSDDKLPLDRLSPASPGTSVRAACVVSPDPELEHKPEKDDAKANECIPARTVGPPFVLSTSAHSSIDSTVAGSPLFPIPSGLPVCGYGPSDGHETSDASSRRSGFGARSALPEVSGLSDRSSINGAGMVWMIGNGLSRRSKDIDSEAAMETLSPPKVAASPGSGVPEQILPPVEDDDVGPPPAGDTSPCIPINISDDDISLSSQDRGGDAVSCDTVDALLRDLEETQQRRRDANISCDAADDETRFRLSDLAQR